LIEFPKLLDAALFITWLDNNPYQGASVVFPQRATTIMLANAPSLLIAALTLGSAAQAAMLPPLGALIDQVRVGGGEAHAMNSWSYSDCGMSYQDFC
jgi:hypothetical protein